MNLLHASEKYISSLPTSTSPETIRLYRRGLDLFFESIGDKDSSQVSETDFLHYCQNITERARSENWSPRTQHAYTRGPVGFLIFLAEEKLSDNILPQVLWSTRRKRIAKVPRPAYKLPKGVESFVDRLYTFPAPPSDKENVYQRFILEHAFVAAIVSSGARIHEICKIKMIDIDGRRALVKGKGGKSGYINFTAEAWEIIGKWIRERKAKSPYLFPALRAGKHKSPYLHTVTGREIIYRWIRILIGESEEKITPHTFRHLAIKIGIQERGLRWAQKQARHSSPETTALYDESDSEEVSRAYDEVFSRKKTKE